MTGYVPSILRASPRCPTCGEPMDPSRVYHPSILESVTAWVCVNDECDQRPLVRDEEA